MRCLLPPPDLHALIREHGTYSKIPAAVWDEYDHAVGQWKDDLRNDQLLIENTSQPTGASARGAANESAGESESQMTIEDMSEYAGTDYIKFKDLQANGPRVEVIVDCVPGNFQQPDLIFESGSVLTLNVTSIRALVRVYGKDARDWIHKTVKCYAGQVPFKDGMTDAALVEPAIAPTSDEKLPPPKSKDGDLNDAISF